MFFGKRRNHEEKSWKKLKLSRESSNLTNMWLASANQAQENWMGLSKFTQQSDKNPSPKGSWLNDPDKKKIGREKELAQKTEKIFELNNFS